MHYFFPTGSAYVLNQSHSHWLLFNALQSIITMCLKCREKVTNPPTQVNFINDCYNGIVFKLSLFTTNIKKEVVGVLDSFFHFLSRYEEKNCHKMLN